VNSLIEEPSEWCKKWKQRRMDEEEGEETISDEEIQ